MFNIIIFALLSVFVSADTEQIVAKNCLGDYVCYIPKECCRQGCCYSPDYIPKTTTPPASGSFIGHWCFWAAITAILAGIACVCSVWRRLKSILFCCRDSARNELAPEHNANGSVFYQAPPPYSENEAIVVLVSPQQTVNGTIKFRQTDDGVVIEGEVTGLTPGLHGFHVHSKGDLSDGCASTGSHYNPFKKQHGAPNDTERHVGDLGNIEADDKGVAKIQITDKVISLRSGDTNILGRAIVVHEGEDDLGKGNFSDSLTTGHAGGRVACGIIGILSESWDWKSSGNTGMPNGLLLVAVLIFSFFTTRWW